MKLLTILSVLLSFSVLADSEVKIVQIKAPQKVLVKSYEFDSMDEAGATIVKALKEVDTYVKKHKLKTEGVDRAVVVRNNSRARFSVQAGIILVKAPKKVPAGFEYVTIPAGDMAVAVHKGSYANLKDTFKVLRDWEVKNNRTIIGEAWQAYINSPSQTAEADLITEIQGPLNPVK